MMNRYPLWKNLLVVLITASGLLFALPNLYGEDPAVQVSAKAGPATAAMQQQVEQALKTAKLDYKSAGLDDGRVLVRFPDTDAQLHGLDAIQQTMGPAYTAAMNLAPRTPAWMQSLGMKPMAKGLDLQGGVHFQLLVDLNAASQGKLQRISTDLSGAMRAKLIRYEDVSVSGDAISLQLATPDDVSHAKDLLTRQYPEMTVTAGASPNSLLISMQAQNLQDLRQQAVEQNITTLRNRVNELGVAEPIVQQQGPTSIVVELPGVQDAAHAKDILGGTATLEFRLVDYTADPYQAQQTNHIPLDDQLFTRKDNGQPVLLKRDVIASGDQLVNAQSGFSQDQGTPDVNVTLDSAAAAKMGETTRQNLGKPMAVLFIETKSDTKMVDGQPVITHSKVYSVINVATIQGIFSKNFQITGLGGDEAKDLHHAARRLAGRAHGLHRGAYRGPEPRCRKHPPRFLRRRARFRAGGGVHGPVLQDLRRDRGCRGVHEPGADGGAALAHPGDPDPTRHRRHRADARHGRGCQRAHQRARARRGAQRQHAAGGDPLRL